ncbi:MAG TPA: S8 family serine peptidase [Thermoanaerobaculia bacterium]|nr:S8 family serine peptidase [Thermoanaerobaculia bacterium]
MERFVRAVIVLLTLIPLSVHGENPELVSTHCREVEVALDAKHSVSRLEGCGEEYSEDLLWDLDRIDQVDGTLDGHFDRTNRGAGSVVYVMDTGVMAAHTEFLDSSGRSRVIAGFDTSGVVPFGASRCRSDNKPVAPCYSNFDELVVSSHGTSVASIIAGRRVGVAPGADIVSIRVMNERGLATTRSYLDGLNAIIRHAWSEGVPPFRTAIVNISGWVLEQLTAGSDPAPVPYAMVEQKMRDMAGGVDANGKADPNGKRFLFVVAANNVDTGCGASGYVDRFPAVVGKRVDGVITVGGMTVENSFWSGSCRGDVEVLAPAKNIFSAFITGPDQYRGKKPNLRSGTSFAAPIISGIAARLLAESPAMTPAELEAAITNTPSRIDNAAAVFADGKVGYAETTLPTRPQPMISSGVTAENRSEH